MEFHLFRKRIIQIFAFQYDPVLLRKVKQEKKQQQQNVGQAFHALVS